MKRLCYHPIQIASAVAVLAWFAGTVHAQYLQETGSPTFAASESVPMGYVNVANGNLHIEIPFVTSPQRGGRMFVGKMVYDSRIWKIVDTGGSLSWQPTNVPGTQPGMPGAQLGWRFVYTGGGTAEYDTITSSCVSGGNTYYWQRYQNYRFTDESGTTRRFPLTGENSVPCHTAATSTTTGPSLDATGYQMNRSLWTDPDNVVAPDGTQVYMWASSSTKIWRDPNGNFIERNNSTGNIIDTLNRTVLQKTEVSGTETDYTFQTSSGASTFKVFYTLGTVAIATDFEAPGVTEYSGGLQAVARIEFPDGSFYNFGYENDLPYRYGLLKSMTVPTGEVVSFTHENFIDAQNKTQRWLRTVTEAGGTWNFTPATCGTNCNKVTATRPSGDETVYTFTLNNGAWNTQTKAYSGSAASGTLALTVGYDYDTTLTNPITGGSGFIRRTRVTTTVPGPAGDLVKKTEGLFDTFTYSYQGSNVTGSRGNATTVSEYAYGSGASGGLVRQLVMSYLHDSNPSYASKNIVKQVTNVQTKNAGGTKIAEIASTYDSVAPTSLTGVTHHDDAGFGTGFNLRGNATVTQSWTGAGYLATNFAYDTTGQILNTTDSKGNVTQISYVDNFYTDDGSNPPPATSPAPPVTNAYITRVTMPVSGFALYGYYYGSGKLAFTTEQNNRTTYLHYMDSLDRPTKKNFPGGGWVQNTFSTATHIVHNATLPSGTFQDQHDNDSLGRPDLGSLNDPEGTTYGDTNYDSSGRILNTSNPYRSTSESTYGTNSLQYDGLNRITRLTRQDSNYTEAAYGAAVGGAGGRTTQLCAAGTYGVGYPKLYKDEAGKKRQNWVDAFGNVIEVDEPDASGSLTLGTCSKYDVLGNLIQVDQGSQTRTWVYDALSRLTSETTPEGGTESYYYTTSGGALCAGAAHTICRSTDARNITATFTYDAENRLTGKSYSNGDPSVTYYYDQTSYNGLTITNGKGRRTGMSDGSGQTAWSYNSEGGVLTIRRTNSGITKSISYTYNINGSINLITYPSGLVVSHYYNTAGRLTQVSCSSAACSGTAFGASAAYTPFGELKALTQGISNQFPSGINLTWSYNNRFQPVNVTAINPAGPVTLLNLTYSFLQAGGKNNGTVASITNGVVSGRSETFTYDELNRVKTAQSTATSGTDCWGQSFSYDRYGNLNSITVTKCSAPTLSLGINNYNQITNSGFNYDLSGNLTGTGSATYTWTAADQLASTAGVTYTYDGDGRRVKKSNGTLYWYGRDGEVVAESNLSGTIRSEYIYFSGRRIARRDTPSGNIYYYLTDHIGSARLVTNATGGVVEESEYYPFGTERAISDNLDNNYKFTGWERDSESALDHTLYRKYSASLARWLSPDPDRGSPANPQSLNRYPYVLNDPLALVDPLGGRPVSDPSLLGCFPDSPLSPGFGCGWDEDSPCPPGFVPVYGDPSGRRGSPAIESLQSALDYADIRLGPYSPSILSYELGPDGVNVRMSLDDFQMISQFNPVLVGTIPYIIDAGAVILQGLRIATIALLAAMIDGTMVVCELVRQDVEADPETKSCVYDCKDGRMPVISGWDLREPCPDWITRLKILIY